ncbi:MAG: acyltransferase family protein [Planctomycetota bacterium]
MAEADQDERDLSVALPQRDQPVPSARRHDLDAIRSFAMLLGLVLHAALAYIGMGWPVSDEPTVPMLGAIVAIIHGFRMPLFFLLSGFFAAMLLRRRGLRGLLKHRIARIAVPLAIGCVTILPFMEFAFAWSMDQQRSAVSEMVNEDAPAERAPSDDIWTVAAYGDLEGLKAYGEDSEFLDTPDPQFGVTPLGWTALRDRPSAAAYLLKVGADPSARYRDGHTPMHTACFFGRDEVAQHLLGAGADLTLASPMGELPPQAMRHGRQLTESLARMMSIPIDFERVEEGRARIRAMIETRAAELPAKAGTGAEEAGLGWRFRLFDQPFFGHLWFLWFLCWLIAAMVALVKIGRLVPRVRLPAWLFAPPLFLVWAVPLTMAAQFFMRGSGSFAGFGPDTSAGLLPMPHMLAYYGVFFGVGAAVFAARGPGVRLGRGWPVTISIAWVFLWLGLTFGSETEWTRELVTNETAHWWVSVLMETLYAWTLSLALIGLCEVTLTRERRWVRYVSDSSYWLYVIHLPLFVLGQGAMLSSGMPTLAKFAVLSLGGTAVLLVSYQLFVRHTPIGWLLNGKRNRPGRDATGSA